MMRVKEIFFKNTTYKVPIDELKHINGFDVIKLPNQKIVYYNDLEGRWKFAPESLIEEYSGKRYINVELNGELVRCLSYIDLEEDVDDKKITTINMEYIVVKDETSSVWRIVDKNDPIYKEYIQEKS